MPIKAVMFDVFGTIARIKNRTDPYRALMHRARLRRADFAKIVMSREIGILQAASLFNCNLSNEELCAIEVDLLSELSSIDLYDDAAETMRSLRREGYKIGLCSNLALPYVQPMKSLLPFDLDACAWSCSVGYIKPEHGIYAEVCYQLRCQPGEILFVGDSIDADVIGPSAFGMKSVLLDRMGRQDARGSISRLSQVSAYLDILKMPPIL